MHHAALLASTLWGSPSGATTQDRWTRELWEISGWFALPIGLLVAGLIAWSLFRYRERPGRTRTPAQFQYHIPIEAAYTIIPLIIVAVIFGFMYNAENQVDKITPQPAVKIYVEGFQWGWRFVYPENGHAQVGTADYNNINDNHGLPTLVMPAGEPVQLQVVSLDVVHTFYVKDFLFNRDLIPGIKNVFDLNVQKPGIYPGQCNNICGQYHAYMRFNVQVMTPSDFNTWMAQQGQCTTTTAGVDNDQPVPAPGGVCPNNNLPSEAGQ
jgi:cytochrome c oxidase subunit 2